MTTFHKLTKEADEVASSKAADKQAKLRGLQRELEEMGGRQAYQSASLLSVSFHNTSKWVTQQLDGKMGLRPAKGEPPLRVLEVMKGQQENTKPGSCILRVWAAACGDHAQSVELHSLRAF